MATNPLIALQGRTPDPVAAFQKAQRLKDLHDLSRQQIDQGGQQAQINQQTLELNDEKLAEIRADRRARSVAQGAAVALPALERGDIEGTKSFLKQRAAELESMGRDASDTLGVLQKIESGDLQGARADLQQAVQLGQISGILQMPKGTKYSNLKRTSDGRLIGINEASGKFEELPLPEGVSLPQEGGEQFTLKPGETRFDQQGRPIASVAPKPEKPSESLGLTPGEKEIDKKFAPEYVEFKAAGGYADVQKQLEQLKEAEQKLKSAASGEGPNLTGPAIGRVPDAIRTSTNPESIAVRDTVEEVVQRNLRLILGAQFTEKEGIRLIARAYNENLPEAENVKRVGRLIKQIETAARAKQKAIEYFDQNGTLKGFDGELPSLSDFTSLDFGDSGNRIRYDAKGNRIQ